MSVAPKIAIVVDDQFTADRLRRLATTHHVWLVAMAVSAADAKTLANVTTFSRMHDENAAVAMERILETVDDHHGEGRSSPAWTELLLIGAEPTDDMRHALEALGVEDFEVVPEGIVAMRRAGSSEGEGESP